LELIEKWAGEVVLDSIFLWVPVITPPILLVEYPKRLVRGINRDYLLGCRIAFPVVQLALIAPGKTPLHPTERAQRGRRDQFLISIEYRRDMLEKI
jgi:hypothetical protein